MSSLETFQNVDDWLISTDVGSVLSTSWQDEEPAFVRGLDDDGAGTGYLTSPCNADGSGRYDVTDFLNSPLQSKQHYLFCVLASTWSFLSLLLQFCYAAIIDTLTRVPAVLKFLGRLGVEPP